MKRIIAEHQVDALVKDNVLTVGRDLILTPGAREYAAHKGYKISYAESTHTSSRPLGADDLGKLINDVISRELGGRPDLLTTGASSRPSAPPPEAPLPDQSVFGAIPHAQPHGTRAVVAAAGLNRPGIVATLSAAIAEMGCDLASMNQVIVDGYFSLLFIVEISEDRGDMSFRVFKENLKDVASRLGTMEIFVMHEETFQAMHRV